MKDIPEMQSGHLVINANIAGTILFALSAVVAALVFEGVSKVQGVVVALFLFSGGVVAFIWGYWTAVQRSRTHEMSVAELYFLLGSAIPRRTKWVMNSCLLAQTVTALVTALARGSTPDPGVEGGSSPRINFGFWGFGAIVGPWAQWSLGLDAWGLPDTSHQAMTDGVVVLR